MLVKNLVDSIVFFDLAKFELELGEIFDDVFVATGRAKRVSSQVSWAVVFGVLAIDGVRAIEGVFIHIMICFEC